MSLRNDVRKLAAENPTLWRHLVPLLRQAARRKKPSGPPQPFMEALEALAITSPDSERYLKDVIGDTLDSLTLLIWNKAEKVLSLAGAYAAVKAKPRLGKEESHWDGKEMEEKYETTHVSYEIHYPSSVTYRWGIKGDIRNLAKELIADDSYQLDRRAVDGFFKNPDVVRYFELLFKKNIGEVAKGGDLDGRVYAKLERKALGAAYGAADLDTSATRYYADENNESAEEELSVVPDVQFRLDSRDLEVKVFKVDGLTARFSFTFPIVLGDSVLPGDRNYDRLHIYP